MEKKMEKTMPVSKLSYSSLTQLLRNPLIFKLKEILGVYDTKMSVSGMIGRAGHHALKTYYGGNPDVPIGPDVPDAKGIAKETGLAYLDTYDDMAISYGKTGNRESMLKGYTQAMDFYFAEEPKYNEILMVEEKMEAEIKTITGEILPLPAVGIPDLVHKTKNGEIEIIDVKFTTSFTDYETEDFIKIIQSQFMFHLLLAAKGIKADRMLFREVKRTKNQDGSPQIRDWAIPFDHEQYRVIFYNLYRDVVKFLSNDPIFLPNLSDPFDGEQAGLIYAQGLINADMSDVEVVHKVRDVAFTTKQFVPSRLDSEINKHLLPEEKIKLKLAEFGIPVEPEGVTKGSTITQYRFKVSAGIRMTTLKKHKDDIAKAIEATGEVRIIAPIPGTSLVGVEVESAERKIAKLSPKEIIKGTLSIPIGVDVHGDSKCLLLNEMPHLLVAGSTGSGKSIFIRTAINALIEQLPPEELELILIDPKRVELSAFSNLKHLRGKVIYEYEDALKVLLKLVDEMEERYTILEKAGKRDIWEFNARKKIENRLTNIVLIFDEFADFMIRSSIEESKQRKRSYSARSKEWLKKEIRKRTGKKPDMEKLTKAQLVEALEALDEDDETKRPDANVELLVVRLAQMARAVGIHLIIATQRPSVDVITGLIKANFPTRVALTTASPADSMVILGQLGAEKLSGKGDLLLMSPSVKGLLRLQGFIN